MDQLGGPMDHLGVPMDRLGGPMDQLDGPMDKLDGPMDHLGGPMDQLHGPMTNCAVQWTNWDFEWTTWEVQWTNWEVQWIKWAVQWTNWEVQWTNWTSSMPFVGALVCLRTEGERDRKGKGETVERRGGAFRPGILNRFPSAVEALICFPSWPCKSAFGESFFSLICFPIFFINPLLTLDTHNSAEIICTPCRVASPSRSFNRSCDIGCVS